MLQAERLQGQGAWRSRVLQKGPGEEAAVLGGGGAGALSLLIVSIAVLPIDQHCYG